MKKISEDKYEGLKIGIFVLDSGKFKYSIQEIIYEDEFRSESIALNEAVKIIDASKIKIFDKENDIEKLAKELSSMNNQNPIEPSYYGSKENPLEAIKIIHHYKLDFCLGNSIKYIIRAGKKNPDKYIEDLRKAQWYLSTKIEELEKEKTNLSNMTTK